LLIHSKTIYALTPKSSSVSIKCVDKSSLVYTDKLVLLRVP